MEELYEARKKYGRVYVTLFPDGFLVPWKPLPLQDYLLYTADFQRGFIPDVILEDEVFCLCVQDQSIVRRIDMLKAGIVTSVVNNIMEYSGPRDVENFNADLNIARQITFAGSDRVLRDLVQLSTLAFPVTPDQITAMNYEEFLLFFARAENKLLQIGYLKDPVIIEPPEEEEPAPVPEKPVVDAKALWDQQETVKKQSKVEDFSNIGKDKWWNDSPVLEAKEPHRIDFDLESAEQSVFGLTGHEKHDEYIARAKMVEDSLWIYKDLLVKLEQKKGSSDG